MLSDPFQKGLIITDDIAIEPILDFNLYRNAIVKIVRNSYPKFTIGIFGDWGTGKTTLMHSINRALIHDNDLITVQFEAWRYEREDQFALVPLLKSIAFALPNEKQFVPLKQKLKRGAINFLKQSPEILSSILSRYVASEAGEVTEKMFDSFKKEFNSKVELLAEVDRDTVYFDGFEDITNEIARIREQKPAFRIVVFIDDLDRCLPVKTLEVLESIKVFLGMEGFIYIVGISHDIVAKLIDIEYEKSGVKGEQYIRKMIQIPITLPKWDNQDIIKLVRDFVNKGTIHENYRRDITDNIALVSTAIENNPREIKRFLNNFIVSHEIFSPSGKVIAKELLLIQAIQLRWTKFYDLLMKSDSNFRNELKKYYKLGDDIRLSKLESKEAKEGEKYDLLIRSILRNFKDDKELWEFLEKNSDTLDNIKDWTIYRRATVVSTEPTGRPKGTPETEYDETAKSKALKLLRGGGIDEFNIKRASDFQFLNLRGVNLQNAVLDEADLTGVNLQKAMLSGASIVKAYLTETDLRGANLKGANLTGSVLAGVDFRDANLSDSIILVPDFGNTNHYPTLNENSVFDGGIIDNDYFLDVIRNFTQRVP